MITTQNMLQYSPCLKYGERSPGSFDWLPAGKTDNQISGYTKLVEACSGEIVPDAVSRSNKECERIGRTEVQHNPRLFSHVGSYMIKVLEETSRLMIQFRKSGKILGRKKITKKIDKYAQALYGNDSPLKNIEWSFRSFRIAINNKSCHCSLKSKKITSKNLND